MLLFFLKKQIAGVDPNPLAPSESVERLKTQPKPQEEATAHHSNWFGSMFGSKKKEPPVQQGIVWSLLPVSYHLMCKDQDILLF